MNDSFSQFDCQMRKKTLFKLKESFQNLNEIFIEMRKVQK